MNALYKYTPVADKVNALYDLVDKHLECFLAGIGSSSTANADNRIRVVFSTDVLAYFFKLLYKAGAINGTLANLIFSLSKNFATSGIGTAYISPNALTTRYKQVVQTTARSVRALLLKMLKYLDEEFNPDNF